MIDGQCVLEKLLHMMGASWKGGRQDDSLTERLCVNIYICSHTICEASIDLSTNGVLIHHDEAQPVLL